LWKYAQLLHAAYQPWNRLHSKQIQEALQTTIFSDQVSLRKLSQAELAAENRGVQTTTVAVHALTKPPIKA
jgi:hypothetical protein